MVTKKTRVDLSQGGGITNKAKLVSKFNPHFEGSELKNTIFLQPTDSLKNAQFTIGKIKSTFISHPLYSHCCVENLLDGSHGTIWYLTFLYIYPQKNKQPELRNSPNMPWS